MSSSRTKKSKVTPACAKCTGLCCRYFALQLDTPKDWDDFDNIRWYLSHEHTTVFVEDGQWFLNINNKCRYLSEDNHRCQNYAMRPKICRGYTTKNCDIVSDEYDYEMHFTNDKQMEEYMRIKFGSKVFDKLDTPKKKRKTSKKAKSKR